MAFAECQKPDKLRQPDNYVTVPIDLSSSESNIGAAGILNIRLGSHNHEPSITQIAIECIALELEVRNEKIDQPRHQYNNYFCIGTNPKSAVF